MYRVETTKVSINNLVVLVTTPLGTKMQFYILIRVVLIFVSLE